MSIEIDRKVFDWHLLRLDAQHPAPGDADVFGEEAPPNDGSSEQFGSCTTADQDSHVRPGIVSAADGSSNNASCSNRHERCAVRAKLTQPWDREPS